MFVVFLAAKAESLSYAPGVALWSALARSESSFCAASSSGVSATTWGAEVSGLQPVRQGGDLGFFDLRWCLDDCARASNAPTSERLTTSIQAIRERRIEEHNDTAFSGEPQNRAKTARLVMARGRGVRIFAQGVRVPVCQDFHHPAIKVVDRMVHDGFETAVVFSMSFFNVVFQSYAEIFVLAAQAHLLRTEHFNILHRNLGDPICAAVQFLFFGGEAVDVKLIAELTFRAGGRRRQFDQFERFRFGMQLQFGGDRRLNDRRRRSGRSLGRLRHWLRRHWALWRRRRNRST